MAFAPPVMVGFLLLQQMGDAKPCNWAKQPLGWGSWFPGETARVGSETRQPMFGFELVIAAAIWTPLTVAACKWIADA